MSVLWSTVATVPMGLALSPGLFGRPGESGTARFPQCSARGRALPDGKADTNGVMFY